MRTIRIIILLITGWIVFPVLSLAQEEQYDSTIVVEDPPFELLKAASKGDTSMIRLLLKFGVDVNTTDYDGVTPLMFAAQNGHLRAVEILIDAGADIDAKPYSQIDALLSAAIAGHVLVADTLILNGANVNTRTLYDQTPLMYAVAFGYNLLADVLIFYKAKISLKDYYGNQAIHYASYYGNLDAINLLLNNGDDMNAKEEMGFTPLMIASQKGYADIVAFLLEAGAIVDLTNSQNANALALAIENKNEEVVELLLTAGADPNFAISEKSTMIDLARRNSSENILEMLVENGATPEAKFKPDIFQLNSEMIFSGEDIFLGGRMGLLEPRLGISLQAGFHTRPTVRSVLLDESDLVSYQYWERRSLASIGVKKYLYFNLSNPNDMAGVQLGAGAGYTYGSFRGSGYKPEDHLLLFPSAGFFYSTWIFTFSLDYQYLKFRNSGNSPHMFNLGFGVNIGTYGSKIQNKREPEL